MASLLEDVYCGFARPMDKINHTAEYEEVLEKAEKLEDQLMESLDTEQKRVFDEVLSTENELINVAGKERFLQGYSHAIKMLAEALTNQL